LTQTPTPTPEQGTATPTPAPTVTVTAVPTPTDVPTGSQIDLLTAVVVAGFIVLLVLVGALAAQIGRK
jgi:hypothetical protein